MHRIPEIVYFRIRQSGVVEDLEPLFRGLRDYYVFNLLFQHIKVLDSRGVCGEAFICGPFGSTQSFTQDAKQAIVASTEQHNTFRCPE